MKYLLFLISFLSFNLYSQNGTIISQEQFTVTDEELIQFYDARSPKMDHSYLDIHKKVLELVSFYHITYLSDGLKVKGYMAIPKGKGEFPCVIFNRGGGGDYGKINDTDFVVLNLGEISAAGYIVVASQYRGSDGAEGKDEYGGKEISDVLNLLPLLGNIEKADTSRIGMYGGSRGGIMTYQALTKTQQIKAAIVMNSPVDLIEELKFRPDIEKWMPMYIDNYEDNKIEELKKRSATYFVDSLTTNTPILILQGGGDDSVNPIHFFSFTQKLFESKVPFRSIFYEGGNHILLEHRNDALNQMITWLNKYVRDGEQWPSLEPHGLLSQSNKN